MPIRWLHSHIPRHRGGLLCARDDDNDVLLRHEYWCVFLASSYRVVCCYVDSAVFDSVVAVFAG